MSNASLVSVVEDDPFFRDSMRRLMRSLGYSVETFSSAADFLASPRLAETACLIADVHMPAMTGVELCRHLIEAGYAIPTILMTAYPNDIDRARALNDGVVCYLRKPIDERDLIRCLHAALHSADRLKRIHELLPRRAGRTEIPHLEVHWHRPIAGPHGHR
jgi:FixJ family two-component response regulator